MIIDVQSPSGHIYQRQLTAFGNGVVDNMEIALLNASESGGVIYGNIIAYNLATQISLIDGSPINISGSVDNEWVASFNTAEQPFSPEMYVSDYSGIDYGQKLIAGIDLTFVSTSSLSFGQSFSMPLTYRVASQGSDVAVVNSAACDLIGDQAPCGETSLSEVFAHINNWAAGQATLSQVINLINRWSEDQ